MLFIKSAPQFINAGSLVLPLLKRLRQGVEVYLLDKVTEQAMLISIHQGFIIEACPPRYSLKGCCIFLSCHSTSHLQGMKALTGMSLSVGISEGSFKAGAKGFPVREGRIAIKNSACVVRGPVTSTASLHVG